MAGLPIVAVAASAGGVEALKRLVGGLPSDLPAALLVSLHLPADGRTMLRDILARRTRLNVVNAADGLPLRAGHVYVSQSDAHLLVVDGHLALGRGARENGHRPSHDAMLRSVGLAAGPLAVGVVLTGLLDDGAAGLKVVERYGGATLVQDPEDAEFPSMPRHALLAVPAARRVSLDGLAQGVLCAVGERRQARPVGVPDSTRARDALELRSALREFPVGEGAPPVGEPSPYACPDCHGVLNHVSEDGPLRFRCRTGHAWTAESFLARQTEAVEDALWTALRILEERGQLAQNLAEQAVESKRVWSAAHYRRRAEDAERAATSLRLLLRPSPATQQGADGA